MKSLNNYINEWKYNGDNVKKKITYSEHPKTKEDLEKIIIKRLKENKEDPYLLDIDVSEINDMSYLFSQDTMSQLYEYNYVPALKRLDLSTWNTKSLKECNHMFYLCLNVEEIIFGGMFNTSKVETMMSMFADCEHITSLDLSMFDISNVKNMQAMFYGCRKLEKIKGVEKWDIDSIENNDYMFVDCDSLKYNYYDKYQE